jgi:hypothetical protein
MDKDMKYAVQDKVEFRRKLGIRMSITHFDFMLNVLNKIHNNKATVLDPELYLEKIKRVERKSKADAYERKNTQSTVYNSFIKSMVSFKTMTTEGD